MWGMDSTQAKGLTLEGEEKGMHMVYAIKYCTREFVTHTHAHELTCVSELWSHACCWPLGLCTCVNGGGC